MMKYSSGKFIVIMYHYSNIKYLDNIGNNIIQIGNYIEVRAQRTRNRKQEINNEEFNAYNI